MARGAWLAVLLAGGLAACAGREVRLPEGEGEPFPDAARAWQEVTSSCRDVRTWSAELSISGRAGSRKLRGRVIAALAAPDRVRLEAAAPFGPPVFILAADGAQTTLWLPRDRRVVRGERPAAVLEALTGVDLGPSDLLAILTGCVAADGRVTAGRRYASGWARVDLASGWAAFLRREDGGGWRVRAGVRPGLGLEYEAAGTGGPAVVHLHTDPSRGPASDLRIRVSQVDVGQAFGPSVFSVKVPADAAPMSLVELREAGPLGERR